MQAEFHKALDILASAKGDSKKAVSVVFSGNGNRRVGVGYVMEAPLWKPTYRLTVDDKGVMRLQGWAAIENTTDEDWVNVKVGLVAGRPMAFQMDLYDPLFIPRPMVESDLFASVAGPSCFTFSDMAHSLHLKWSIEWRWFMQAFARFLRIR